MFRFEKSADKDFVVLNLADTQLKSCDWGENNPGEILMKSTVEQLIEISKPDLITLSGDFSFAYNPDSYYKTADYLETLGIPWAFVFGNHDNQGGEEFIDKMADFMLTKKGCVFEKGDKSLGCGNYIISIEENGKPIYALAMLDSHDRMPYVNDKGETKDSWAHLIPEQFKWYKEQIESLGGIRCGIITHIPIYAFREVFKKAWNDAYDPKSITMAESYDEKYWNEGFKGSFGLKYEGIESYPLDTHELERIKEVPSTDLILVGHDHVNNFVIEYDGIKFVYGYKVGLGCYWNENINGGTVLRISKEKTVVEQIPIDAKAILGK